MNELRSRNHSRDERPSSPDRENKGPGPKQPGLDFWSWVKKMLEELIQVLELVVSTLLKVADACNAAKDIKMAFSSFTSET